MNHSNEPAPHAVVSLLLSHALAVTDSGKFNRALSTSVPGLGGADLQEWVTIVNENTFESLPVFRGFPLSLSAIPPFALGVGPGKQPASGKWTIGWRVFAPRMETKGCLLVLNTNHPLRPLLFPDSRDISEVVYEH